MWTSFDGSLWKAVSSGNVIAAWRILHYLTVRGQWPSWTVAKSGLDTLYVHAMNSILKGIYCTCLQVEISQSKLNISTNAEKATPPTNTIPVVSHALAHSYAYASLITLSKSIPNIVRLISRQQVFSFHLFQSLEICFKFQCTYCCLYFMTKSGSRDQS